MIQRTLRTGLVAGLLGLAAAGAAFAAGGGKADKPSTPPPSIPEEQMTPEQKAAAAKEQAEEFYNKGYEEVDAATEEIDQAVKLEKNGEPDTDAQAKKLRDSAAKHYKKASEKFAKAVQILPEYHEAWNMLGYSFRKTGQIGNAFKAYETCLKLKPDYEPAHEYRGEAYIISGDMDKAKAELDWLKEKKSNLAARLELAIQNHNEGKAPPSGTGW